jgi:hypothetical protein
LCQNAPPGVWAGKAGAPAELDAVEQAYRHDGQFAILHSMTNCLRIGDVTIFRGDGSRETIEVKSDPQRSKSAQQRRIKAANDALQNAAALPGKDRRARLFDSDVQFRTHLDVLAVGTQRAAREGISQHECAATGPCWSWTSTDAASGAGPTPSSQGSWRASSAGTPTRRPRPAPAVRRPRDQYRQRLARPAARAVRRLPTAPGRLRPADRRPGGLHRGNFWAGAGQVTGQRRIQCHVGPAAGRRS